MSASQYSFEKVDSNEPPLQKTKSFVLDRTLSKFPLKGVPLSGYRTGDSFYYTERIAGKSKFNTKVLVTGGILTFFLACIIFAVVFGANPQTFQTKSSTFNHNMVEVYYESPACLFVRNCTKNCDTLYLEHLTGCCWGCGIADICSFPVVVNWTDVVIYELRQRIWLFVSLDGHYFFQSGYAPIVGNVTGSAVIADGCFGEIGHAVLFVACLSDLNLENAGFEGFPASRCNSTFGVCGISGGALLKGLNVCQPDNTWIGNTYTTV